MRLWLLLTLVVDGLILLASAGYGFYIAGNASDRLLRSMQSDAAGMARSIAAATSDDLLLGNFDRIESRLLRMATIGSVLELDVFDAGGRQVIRINRESIHATPSVDYAGPRRSLDLTPRTNLVPDKRYVLVEPIGNAPNPVGWVQVTWSLEELATLRQSIWFSTLFAALVTALVVSVLLGYLIHQLTASLGRAAQFAGDLAGHQGETLLTGSPIFEVDQLQRALNLASQALAKQFQSLHDSEQRKAAMLEANLDCLVTMDQDGCIVGFNPAAEQTFGWSQGEVIGMNLGEVMVPLAHRAAHAKGLRKYLATGEGPVLRKRIEITAVRRNGEEFPVELTVVPFEGEGKQFFLGAIRDISERAELETERSRVNAQLVQAVRDMAAIQFALDQHAIVSKADVAGNITYVNEKFLRISGYSSDELIGKNHRLLKSGMHDDNFYQAMWESISEGRIWHGEIANRDKNGKTYWVASTIVPTPGEDGLPQQFISVRTDITAQKQTEASLELARHVLESLVEKYRVAELEIASARARELDVGSQIQRTLLFGSVPARFGSLELAVHSEASKGVNGDFYEFFSYRDGVCDISAGDVMGKGIPAALIGAAVKRQLSQVMAEELGRSIAHEGIPEPATLINALHQHITAQLFALESFVTLSYLRFDIPKRRATLVSAGHLPVLSVGPQGIRWLDGDNLPLGVLANEIYVQREFDIEDNELLFLYSDGYTEAQSPDGTEFGFERLGAVVRDLHAANLPVTTLLEGVRKVVADFEHASELSDDRTCIAIRLKASGAELSTELELPWDIGGLGAMRDFVEFHAGTAGLSEDACGALILATYEAATNVLRHAKRCLVDSKLLVRAELHDSSIDVSLFYVGDSFVPTRREPDFTGHSEGGFGLYIIENSVDAVRYESPAPGVALIHLSKRKPESST
jgi:phosphoserine phosphatase RsbU/P